jgi:hypothetical protein
LAARNFPPELTRNGQTLLTKAWAMKVAHAGRRSSFSLGTPNKAAAAKARDIYLFLAANGWEAALARYKKAKPVLRGQGVERPPTIGEFLDEVFRTASNQKTVEGYAKS